MKNNMLNSLFVASVFNDVWDTNNEQLNKNYYVEFILGIIKTGDYGVAEKVTAIRNLATKDERDKLKMKLQVIMWQGIFSHRNNNGCKSLSSLVCIDVDHQTDIILEQIKQAISSWPFVLAFFKSPSGDGLKVIIRTDNFAVEDYGNCYRQVERLFSDTFGIEPDNSCEDISHPCFISYDPDIYYNPDAIPWHYEYKEEFDKPKIVQHQKSSSNNIGQDIPQSPYDAFMAKMNKARCPLSDEQIITILDIRWSKFPDNYKDGNRTKSIFVQASTLSKAGIDESKAIDYLKTKFLPTGFREDKLEYETQRAYQKSKHLFGSERCRYKSYDEYKIIH